MSDVSVVKCSVFDVGLELHEKSQWTLWLDELSGDTAITHVLWRTFSYRVIYENFRLCQFQFNRIFTAWSCFGLPYFLDFSSSNSLVTEVIVRLCEDASSAVLILKVLLLSHFLATSFWFFMLSIIFSSPILPSWAQGTKWHFKG